MPLDISRANQSTLFLGNKNFKGEKRFEVSVAVRKTNCVTLKAKGGPSNESLQKLGEGTTALGDKDQTPAREKNTPQKKNGGVGGQSLQRKQVVEKGQIGKQVDSGLSSRYTVIRGGR